MFVQFGFDREFLVSVKFDWVGVGMNNGVGDCWWLLIQVMDVGLGYCYGGFGGFAGTDWGFP